MALTIFYGIFGETLVSLISRDETVQSEAYRYLWWIVLSPLIGVWGFLLDGIFIGITHTRAMRNGMLLALLCFVTSTLLLVPIMGNHGLWLAYFILMIARAITLGLSLRRIKF